MSDYLVVYEATMPEMVSRGLPPLRNSEVVEAKTAREAYGKVEKEAEVDLSARGMTGDDLAICIVDVKKLD